MIADLTPEMNRVRQAEITQEILEVVAGAEALDVKLARCHSILTNVWFD